MRVTRLSADYFGQTVSFVTAAGVESSVAAHVRHRIREDRDPDTNVTTIVEVIDVELDRAEVTAAPSYGDRIYLAGDDRAYLYTYVGRHRVISWVATCERRRQTAGR